MAEVLNKTLDVLITIAIVCALYAGSFVWGEVIPENPKETGCHPILDPTAEETIPATQKPTETTEPVTEATEATEGTEPLATEPPVILYDVPLATDLQLHIISEAESHGIDPAIIFAIIYRESSFDAAAIGDNGNSLGLMQIQPRWCKQWMEELDCMDLLDPFQNVTVGISVLAWQLDRYDGYIAKALVAYNQGHFKGTVTDYAKDVLEKAEELRGETYAIQ